MTAKNNTDQLDWFTAAEHSQQVHQIDCQFTQWAAVCLKQKPTHIHIHIHI